MVISHIKQDHLGEWQIQTNEEHQQNVAELASSFASQFGMAEWGKVIGLLHDVGKEQKNFQQHIKKESGYEPDTIVKGDYNHAYVGALVAKKMFNTPTPYYLFIDNIIMGHHRGLYDDGEKRRILEREIPTDVSTTRLNVNLNMPPCKSPQDIHHIIRMLFSCLVDADRLDTERFMSPDKSQLRESKSSLDELLVKLENFLISLKKRANETEVNKIRNEVQQYCIEQSQGEIGYYSLTVPTGGGKTLSSVLWALKHAIKNNQKRIIIAIPYTSIIVQTASVLRKIFGEENVLEHHSMVNVSDEKHSETTLKQQLATENWDYPIIVTTNVQLFESLFSNNPSDCRKLHNIARSVIILDEVQTLPIKFLKPIIDTFDTLKHIFSVSFLFTTASQPILSGKIKGTIHSFMALPDIKEIIPSTANLHDRLRRVELAFDKDSSTHESIANRMREHNVVLCIVNTRNDAYEIYKHLPQEGLTLHLSRMMCPLHIRETIETIKDALKRKEGVIRVVSTQLVEAGVDIDFPVVFRQEAGLDSILQAAGRCNREGKLGICTTHVFKLDKPLPPGMMTQANEARRNMLGDYDWFSTQAMQEYFKQLYSRVQNFDEKGIADLLYKQEQNYETASHAFQLIDDNTVSVIINWQESSKLVDLLTRNGYSKKLQKQLSQYTVSVRGRDFNKLLSYGAIEEVMDGIYFLPSPDFYDINVGLKINNQWVDEIYIK